MSELTFFSDFTSLSQKDAGKWVEKCSTLAEAALKDSSHKVHVLANVLLLEQYFNTWRQGLQKEGKELAPVVSITMELLWDYLFGTKTPSEFDSYANCLYAGTLEDLVGEELTTEEQNEFYQKYFNHIDFQTIPWVVLSSAAVLMLELVSIYGGKVEFDELKDCDEVSFLVIDDMLNQLNDVCVELAGIECPSCFAKDVIKAMDEALVTTLFQSIVSKVQKSFLDAMNTEPQDYEKLREAYRQYAILPEEFVCDFLDYET